MGSRSPEFKEKIFVICYIGYFFPISFLVHHVNLYMSFSLFPINDINLGDRDIILMTIWVVCIKSLTLGTGKQIRSLKP